MDAMSISPRTTIAVPVSIPCTSTSKAGRSIIMCSREGYRGRHGNPPGRYGWEQRCTRAVYRRAFDVPPAQREVRYMRHASERAFDVVPGADLVRYAHVPKHQNALQLRSARDRRGDPRRGAPVRPQDQRLQQALPRQRGGVRAGARCRRERVRASCWPSCAPPRRRRTARSRPPRRAPGRRSATPPDRPRRIQIPSPPTMSSVVAVPLFVASLVVTLRRRARSPSGWTRSARGSGCPRR